MQQPSLLPRSGQPPEQPDLDGRSTPWGQDRKTKVEVSVSGAVVAYTDQPDHVVAIRVSNRNEHPVRVTSLGFQTQTNRNAWFS
jgi:hypothetical protein